MAGAIGFPVSPRIFEDFSVFFIIWIDEVNLSESSSIVELRLLFCPFLLLSILTGFTNFRPNVWTTTYWVLSMNLTSFCWRRRSNKSSIRLSCITSRFVSVDLVTSMCFSGKQWLIIRRHIGAEIEVHCGDDRESPSPWIEEKSQGSSVICGFCRLRLSDSPWISPPSQKMLAPTLSLGVGCKNHTCRLHTKCRVLTEQHMWRTTLNCKPRVWANISCLFQFAPVTCSAVVCDSVMFLSVLCLYHGMSQLFCPCLIFPQDNDVTREVTVRFGFCASPCLVFQSLSVCVWPFVCGLSRHPHDMAHAATELCVNNFEILITEVHTTAIEWSVRKTC